LDSASGYEFDSSSGPNDEQVPIALAQSQSKNGNNGKNTKKTISQIIPSSSGNNLPLIASLAGVGLVAIVAIAGVMVSRTRHQNRVRNMLVARAASFNNFGANSPANKPAGGTDTSTLPLGLFTVISTYTPTLDDELEVRIGDQVTVLVEFDDGWVQGVNEARGKVKGVFPRTCIDMNRGGSPGAGGGGSGYAPPQMPYEPPKPALPPGRRSSRHYHS